MAQADLKDHYAKLFLELRQAGASRTLTEILVRELKRLEGAK